MMAGAEEERLFGLEKLQCMDSVAFWRGHFVFTGVVLFHTHTTSIHDGMNG
jgi:hypothetical protein